MIPTSALVIHPEIPAMYDYQNYCNWVESPSTIHCKGTALHNYFSMRLFQRAMSVLTYELPEEINPYYFKWVLWTRGFITVFKSRKFGPAALFGTPEGRDLYYYPKYMNIANPALGPGGLKLRLGKQCEVINLQGTWTGINDIVSMYSDLLAIAMETWAAQCKKAIAADFYGVENKGQAEAMKKATDLAQSGEMDVFITKDLFRDDGTLNVASFNRQGVYIGDKILDDVISILNQFDTTLGIDNANTQKKERLNIPEVEVNTEGVKSKLEMWVSDMQETCRRIEKNPNIGFRIWIDMRNKKTGEEVDESVNKQL